MSKFEESRNVYIPSPKNNQRVYGSPVRKLVFDDNQDAFAYESPQKLKQVDENNASSNQGSTAFMSRRDDTSAFKGQPAKNFLFSGEEMFGLEQRIEQLQISSLNSKGSDSNNFVTGKNLRFWIVQRV